MWFLMNSQPLFGLNFQQSVDEILQFIADEVAVPLKAFEGLLSHLLVVWKFMPIMTVDLLPKIPEPVFQTLLKHIY